MTAGNHDSDVEHSACVAESRAHPTQMVGDGIGGDALAGGRALEPFDEDQAQQHRGAGRAGPEQSALPGLEGY